MTSIQKNVQQAKATGDDKRYGQVASRKKVRTFTLHLTYQNVYIPHLFFFFWLFFLFFKETGKNGHGTP